MAINFWFFASNVKGSSNSNFVHTAYGKTFCHSHTVKFSQKILPEKKKWALLSQFFIESDLMSLMGIEGDT